MLAPYIQYNFANQGASLIAWGSLFNRRDQPLIGLDVSPSSIKLVELGRWSEAKVKPANFTWVLERCALEPLDRPWVVDGHIEQLEPLSQALNRLLQRCNTPVRRVALSLPPSSVITKKIMLPAGLSESDLEAMVQVEANQYIPFPLEDVSLDFRILGPSAASSSDVEVLIAAARREKVQDLQALAEAAGLDPVVVDVESYAARRAAQTAVAAVRALPATAERGLVALLEIGSVKGSLQVLLHDEVVFERDQSFGGAGLTQAIAHHYGYTTEEAESRKRTRNLPDDYGQTVLPAFLEGLAQNVTRALKYFFTSTPYHSVDHILLAGGCANVPGLAEAVSLATQAPASVLNPFIGMAKGQALQATGSSLADYQRHAPSFLTACGLAMRRFDA
jgi:type IV pilus assembly protein PilM